MRRGDNAATLERYMWSVLIYTFLEIANKTKFQENVLNKRRTRFDPVSVMLISLNAFNVSSHFIGCVCM